MIYTGRNGKPVIAGDMVTHKYLGKCVVINEDGELKCKSVVSGNRSPVSDGRLIKLGDQL